MASESLLAAFAAALNLLFIVIGAAIYFSLVRQISLRSAPEAGAGLPRQFGLPEALVAILLTGWFAFLIFLALSRTVDVTHAGTRDLLANAIFTIGLLLGLAAFLRLRGFPVALLGGFSKLSFGRILSTGTILLFASYPLIYVADAITRKLLGSGLSKQEIIELFNNSQTLTQRVIIIVMAVAVAPIAEEFIFRFFLYGVLRRYFGRFIGIIFSALLFAAVHTHLPSFGPLFVLGSCFAIAYEWSGSILVSMTMHALFNSFMLILLAFPQAIPQ